MLSADTLLTELQRFADPDASVFDAWPLDRESARHRWAHTFATYVDDMVDITPVLAPTGVTLVFSAVEQAFFSTLSLVNPDIASAAADFTGAWRAAIAALAHGSPATFGGQTFNYAAMDPTGVDTRATNLEAALVTAFTVPRPTRHDDLKEIADAFHAATEGIMSTPTPFAVTYG